MTTRSPLRPWPRWFSALLLLAIAACAPAPVPAAGDELRVAGGHLVRDGAPFMVKGVQIVAFVAPAARGGMYLEAREHFGKPILEAARRWGANTIRFQLSQPGLDPQSALYSAAYLDEVRSAVALARSMGFAVIASNQGRKASGDRNPVDMPTADTTRAIETLVKLFGADRAVMLELFNEPRFDGSEGNWKLWRDGGKADDGTVLVGAQELIDRARKLGAANVIIVDGLMSAKDFAGAPELHDPAGQLAYGVHPYLGRGNGSEDLWQRRFGYLADRGRLVIATEWSASTAKAGATEQVGGKRWCTRLPMDTPQRLLDFLQRKHIGVVGWSFDVPGTIVTDYSGTPTTLKGKRCGDDNGGPGELLRAYFAAN